MSLKIKRVSFENFRNYPYLELDVSFPLTILCGPNAVGKTNIVEGIQLLTALTSFRHPTVDQMVRKGSVAALIGIELSDDERELALSCSIGDGKRRYELNGKAKRPRDLKGLVPSVTFAPDDLDLVKGAMGGRRLALDELGSQLSRNYHVVRKDYEQVVRYKNRLLKEDAPDDLVESINDTLVTCGSQLSCYRAALFERVSPELARFYGEIAKGGERLEARYTPSWLHGGREGIGTKPFTREEARESLRSVLAARLSDERARHRALVGPHADNIEFLIDGAPAGIYGSQGQQRSCVLAFKMAEVAVIESVLRQKPVLLLDDVMSELDEDRRNSLANFLTNDVQTFITTTNLSYFSSDVLSSAQVVSLPFEEGKL